MLYAANTLTLLNAVVPVTALTPRAVVFLAAAHTMEVAVATAADRTQTFWLILTPL